MAGLLPAPRARLFAAPARSGVALLDLAVVGALWSPRSAALVHVRDAPVTLLRRGAAGCSWRPRSRVPAGEAPGGPEPWGSWFEYALPIMPVFVDPRIELFPTAVWEDYTTLRVARTGGRRSWIAGRSDASSWTRAIGRSAAPEGRPAGASPTPTPDGQLFVRS